MVILCNWPQIVSNRPRSIYQYSNMAPRLPGQNSIFGVVFFVSKTLLGIERQKKLEKFAILTRKLRSHARKWGLSNTPDLYRVAKVVAIRDGSWRVGCVCQFVPRSWIVTVGTDGNKCCSLSVRKSYGVGCKFRRIVPIGTDRDEPSHPWRMVSSRAVCFFARVLWNGHGYVMVWGENVGGSSRSGWMATTRHNLDGWCRSVSICLFLGCCGVRWKCRRIVPFGTDRDDQSQTWKMRSVRVCLSVRERLWKWSWWCYGVGW